MGANRDCAVIALPDLDRRSGRDTEQRLEEAAGLAAAIGLPVAASRSFSLKIAKPGTLFGSGQVDIIGEMIAAASANILIVDGSLSAIQQRNLETRLNVKVIDRTGLILEIFGERAATAEGRLQVELAHLDYQAGRLVRSWTHLERQRGGFGFLGGPGETQIEADRRQIRDRMAKLRRELDDLRKTRSLHRSRRQKAPWPVVALVGYTNAGKSTLFNRLTSAQVVAQDMLFATLDPTMRRFALPGYDKAIVSDTVGFVSDLPTQLVAAFRATLEEVTAADCIVHVRDIAHPASENQRDDVLAILRDLGVEAEDEDAVPMIEAWNKIDLLDDEQLSDMALLAEAHPDCCPISAVTGEGVERLIAMIAESLSVRHIARNIILPVQDGRALAWLHQHGQVLEQREDGDFMRLRVQMAGRDWGRFEAMVAE